ncbi:hypothetical protein [Metamycoplasma equirhinis]|uniref:hypothetical protein n=1 Tax=Metamycoplasma equirhinis TaxID=92402 RepID=UPI0035943F67
MGVVYRWFYNADNNNYWNNHYDRSTKYKLFVQLFRNINLNTDPNFNETKISDISYNYGEGSFTIKYSIQFAVITSVDQNGQINKQHIEKKYEYKPDFKDFILILRYLRTFENDSATGLKQIISYPYPSPYNLRNNKLLSKFHDLHDKNHKSEKWKELLKIYDDFIKFRNQNDGQNGIGFHLNSDITRNREKLLDKEFQKRVKTQYELWISKFKEWFDSIGIQGKDAWTDLLSGYDLTNKDADNYGMGDI